LKKFAGALVILLLLCAAGLAVWIRIAPYAAFNDEVFVEFPKGMPTRSIAAQLERAGVIRSQHEFLIVRALRRKATLQAGEYRFAAPATVWDVFDRIVRGDIFYYEVAAPEGQNLYDIANTVSHLGWMKSSDFLKAAQDPTLIKDLVPQATTLEGYLFPSVYRLARHTSAEQLCKMMTDQFRRVWKQVAPKNQAVDVHRTVTLASLVEKETGIREERRLVASVYRNRLQAGMPLQCDPTTIYAALLENRYRGTIHRSDLDSNHPYNTYRHTGLPPGPIANPGRASLEAALQPAETNYLYLVAKPDGSGAHVFSKDLTSHSAAVRSYRRAEIQ
jgi:UPF0755 protein